MTGTRTPRPALARVALAAALLTAAGCGGDESGSSTAPGSAPASESTAAAPSGSAEPATTLALTTVALSTVAPTTAAPAPADPWSDTAADDLGAVLAAADGSGDVVDVIERLFGNPIDVPLPADAALTVALVTAERVDDTWELSWQFTVASLASPAELQAAAIEGFADDRFEVGVLVTSTLDSGVFVTQNYPATEAADADGWATLSITIGPETDFGTATGRNHVAVSAERTIPVEGMADDPGLAWFVQGWLAEMPVADGLQLVKVRADLVSLSTTGVWLDAQYAPDDAALTFDELVAFYAQEFVDGALSIDASSPPADLSATDRFSAGFFPTLAGYDLFLNVERDLAKPAEPPVVLFNVRTEG